MKEEVEKKNEQKCCFVGRKLFIQFYLHSSHSTVSSMAEGAGM